jgi:hypothetical protein
MRTNGHGIPIVAIDLDGTLADYHRHFLGFAEKYLGEDMPNPEAINNGRPLWEHMGIPVEIYRRMKLAFRQGGWKRFMPAYDGAKTLVEEIRNEGAHVWICTTRPYQKHDAIDDDTMHWLERNRIGYDGVIFDNINQKFSKYDELARQVGHRVAAIADDLPEVLTRASLLAHNGDLKNIELIACRDQPYNRQLATVRLGITRFSNTYGMRDALVNAIERWRMYNA